MCNDPSQTGERKSKWLYYNIPLQFISEKNSELNIQQVASSCSSHCHNKCTSDKSQIFLSDCKGNNNVGLQNGHSLSLIENSNDKIQNIQVGCQGDSYAALQQVQSKCIGRKNRDCFQITPKTNSQIYNWRNPQLFIEKETTESLQSHQSVKFKYVSSNNMAWSKTKNSFSTNSMSRTVSDDTQSVLVKNITTDDNSLIWNVSSASNSLSKDSRLAKSKIDAQSIPAKKKFTEDNDKGNSIHNIQILRSKVNGSQPKTVSTPVFIEQPKIQKSFCDQDQMSYILTNSGNVYDNNYQLSLCDQNISNIQIVKESVKENHLKSIPTPVIKYPVHAQSNLCNTNLMPNIQVVKDDVNINQIKIISTPAVTKQVHVQPNIHDQNPMPNIQVVNSDDGSKLKIVSTPVVTKQVHVQQDLDDKKSRPNIQVVNGDNKSQLKIVSTPVATKQVHVQQDLDDKKSRLNIQVVNGDNKSQLKIVSTPVVTEQAHFQPNMRDQNPVPNIHVVNSDDGSQLKIVLTPVGTKPAHVPPNFRDQNPMPNFHVVNSDDGSQLNIVSTPVVTKQFHVGHSYCNQNPVAVKDNDDGSQIKFVSIPVSAKQSQVHSSLCDQNSIPIVQTVKGSVNESKLKFFSKPAVTKQACVQPSLCYQNPMQIIQVVKDSVNGNQLKLVSKPVATKRTYSQPNLHDETPMIERRNQPNTIPKSTFSDQDTMPCTQMKLASGDIEIVNVSTSIHQEQGTKPQNHGCSVSGDKQSIPYMLGQSVKQRKSLSLQNVETPINQKLMLPKIQTADEQKKSVILQDFGTRYVSLLPRKKTQSHAVSENSILAEYQQQVSKDAIEIKVIKDLKIPSATSETGNDEIKWQKNKLDRKIMSNSPSQTKIGHGSLNMELGDSVGQHIKHGRESMGKSPLNIQEIKELSVPGTSQHPISYITETEQGFEKTHSKPSQTRTGYSFIKVQTKPSQTRSEHDSVKAQVRPPQNNIEYGIINTQDLEQLVCMSQHGPSKTKTKSGNIQSKKQLERKPGMILKSLPSQIFERKTVLTTQDGKSKHSNQSGMQSSYVLNCLKEYSGSNKKLTDFPPSAVKCCHSSDCFNKFDQHTLSSEGMSGSCILSEISKQDVEQISGSCTLSKVPEQPLGQISGSSMVSGMSEFNIEQRGIRLSDIPEQGEEHISGSCAFSNVLEGVEQICGSYILSDMSKQEQIFGSSSDMVLDMSKQGIEQMSKSNKLSDITKPNLEQETEDNIVGNNEKQEFDRNCNFTINRCRKLEGHEETVCDTCQILEEHNTVNNNTCQICEEDNQTVCGTFLKLENQSGVKLNLTDRNERLDQRVGSSKMMEQTLKLNVVDNSFVKRSEEQELEQEESENLGDVFVNEVNFKECDTNQNDVIDKIFVIKETEQSCNEGWAYNVNQIKHKQTKDIVNKKDESFGKQINMAHSTEPSFEQQELSYLVHEIPKQFSKSVGTCKGHQGHSQAKVEDYNIAWVLEHSRQNHDRVLDDTDSNEDISEESIEYVVLSDIEDPDDVAQNVDQSDLFSTELHFNKTDQSHHYYSNQNDRSELSFRQINQRKHFNQKGQLEQHSNWIDQSDQNSNQSDQSGSSTKQSDQFEQQPKLIEQSEIYFNQIDQSEQHLKQIDLSEVQIDQSAHGSDQINQSEHLSNKTHQSEQYSNQIDKLEQATISEDSCHSSEDNNEIESDSDETIISQESDILKCNNCSTLLNQTEALYIYQHTETLEISAKCYKCHKAFSNPLIPSCGEQFSNFPLPIQSGIQNDHHEKSNKEKKKAQCGKRKMNLLLKQRRLFRLLEIRTLNKSYMPGEFKEVVNAGCPLFDDRDRYTQARTEDCKLYQCDTCNKEYKEPGFLRRHMKTHALTDYFQCDVCKMLFKGSKSLSLHSKIHQRSENIGTLGTDNTQCQNLKQGLSMVSVETGKTKYQTSKQGLSMVTMETDKTKYQNSKQILNMVTMETDKTQHQNSKQRLNMVTMETDKTQHQNSKQRLNMVSMETHKIQYRNSKQRLNMVTMETDYTQCQSSVQRVNMDKETIQNTCASNRHKSAPTAVLKSPSNCNSICQYEKSSRLIDNFPCDICNRVLKSPAGLARHKTVHYQQPTEKYACMISNSQTPSNCKKALKRNIKAVFDDVKKGDVEKDDYKKKRYENDIENGVLKENSRHHADNFQYGKNPRPSKLAKALEKIKSKDDYSLNLQACCNFKVDDRSDDRKTNNFMCKICNKSFRTRVGLGVHFSHHLKFSQLTQHTGGKPQNNTHLKHSVNTTKNSQQFYLCEYCNKKCKHQGALGNHRKIHLSSISKSKGIKSEKQRMKLEQVKHEENWKCRWQEKQSKGMKFLIHEENWKREVTEENTNYTRKENWKYSKRISKCLPTSKNDIPKIDTKQKLTISNCQKLTQSGPNVTKFSRTLSASSSSSKHYIVQEKPKHRFSCEKCGEMFLYIADLRSHEACHLQLKPYACGVCNKNFNCPKYLLNHIKFHKEIISFKCTKCKCKFPQLKFLQKHVISCGNTENRFKCEKCNRMFKRFGFLQRHVDSCHVREETNTCTNKKSYTCVSKKKNMYEEKKTQNCVSVTAPKYTKGKTFKLREETAHTLVKKTYLCVKCNASFKSVISLNSHISTEHVLNDRYICGICGKCFQLACTISAHGIAHGDKMVYQCGICKVKVDSFLQLKIHQKQHGQEKKNYACEFCDKRFTYTWNLDLHKRVHTRSQKQEIKRQI